MPERIKEATEKAVEALRYRPLPCPRCGEGKKSRCRYTEGKGYLITLSCAAECGWREVL